MRLTIPVGSAQGSMDRGTPQLGNFLTEEFLGSRVPGHSRVVRIQGWLLAGPKNKMSGGVSHVKLPSKGYRAIGGYSSYSSAVSRYTAPLSLGVK